MIKNIRSAQGTTKDPHCPSALEDQFFQDDKHIWNVRKEVRDCSVTQRLRRPCFQS